MFATDEDTLTSMNRQEEIRAIHKRRHKLFYKWLGILVIIPAIIFSTSAIFFNIGAMFFGDEAHDDYRLNFGTEMMGVAASIGIAVLFIDRLYANRDRERQTQDLKERLVREAGSRSNDKAISAVEQLRDKGWLEGDDGLLKGANLFHANLKKVDLFRANLQGVNLVGANLQEAELDEANLKKAHLDGAKLKKASLGADLQEADLSEANLKGAFLTNADLRNAKLFWTNLQDARLRGADLQGAVLMQANLRGAKLIGADLRGARLILGNLQKANLQDADLQGTILGAVYLQGANLNGANLEGTMLPDATIAHAGMDMERFTNPKHPEFAATLAKINDIRKDIGIGLDNQGKSG